MASTRAVVLSGVSLVCLAFFGCSDPEQATDSNVLANVDASLSPQYTPPLTGGICPPAGAPNPTEWYQGKATTVMQYVVGGDLPFNKEELDKNPECVESFKCTTLLRDLLTDSKSGVTLQSAFADKVCGLPAALFRIDFSQDVNDDIWNEIESCGPHLDGCWGEGVSGFFYADPGGQRDKSHRIYIDPEPVRLTADLTGLTGATAASVYTNTGSGTTTIKWPGVFTSSATPPAAGLPCSTGDIPWGTETIKILQGSGSIRRCY